MITQPNNDSTLKAKQSPLWSDAELRRISRVFDLLIRIDKRLKKGQSNEHQDSEPKTTS
jgi:hypothetical protein